MWVLRLASGSWLWDADDGGLVVWVGLTACRLLELRLRFALRCFGFAGGVVLGWSFCLGFLD